MFLKLGANILRFANKCNKIYSSNKTAILELYFHNIFWDVQKYSLFDFHMKKIMQHKLKFKDIFNYKNNCDALVELVAQTVHFFKYVFL